MAISEVELIKASVRLAETHKPLVLVILLACVLAGTGATSLAAEARDAGDGEPATPGIPVVKTIGELYRVPTTVLPRGGRAKIALAEGGAEAGPWRLVLCLSLAKRGEKDAWQKRPADRWLGAPQRIGPICFTVDDPEGVELRLNVSQLWGETATLDDALFIGAVDAAWPGAYRIRVQTVDGALLAEQTFRVARAEDRAEDARMRPRYWVTVHEVAAEQPRQQLQAVALEEGERDTPIVGSMTRTAYAARPRFGEGQAVMFLSSKIDRRRLADQPIPGQIPFDYRGLLAAVEADEQPDSAQDEAEARATDPPTPALKLALDQERAMLVLTAPEPMRGNPQTHCLARWWVNGKPIAAPDAEHLQKSVGLVGLETLPARRFELELAIPRFVQAKAGDRIGVQLLYCPEGVRRILPRFGVKPAEELKDASTLTDQVLCAPLRSNRVTFKATEAMLEEDHVEDTER